MKKFLKKLKWFTFLVFLLIIISEIALSKFKIFPGDILLNQSIKNFEKDAMNTEVLFLGHSAPFYGINPSKINSKFNIHNFSFASEKIQTTYWKLKYYIDNNKVDNLKYVYIFFEESMLSESVLAPSTHYDYSKYYNHFFNEITETWSTYEKINFWMKINSNLIRVQSSFANFLPIKIMSVFRRSVKNEEVNEFGYGIRTYQINQKDFEKYIPYYINSSKVIHSINEEQFKDFHKLVDLLENNNINVVFYGLGGTSILLKNKSYEKYLQLKNEREIDFIKREFPNHSYINFFDIGIEFFLGDFSDMGHLNNKGANKLSEHIKIDRNYDGDLRKLGPVRIY
tara:strand:+ start:77 stop:1096 length:1020 start_codon:yes stop_codon:yes gene_type:complete